MAAWRGRLGVAWALRWHQRSVATRCSNGAFGQNLTPEQRQFIARDSPLGCPRAPKRHPGRSYSHASRTAIGRFPAMNLRAPPQLS